MLPILVPAVLRPKRTDMSEMESSETIMEITARQLNRHPRYRNNTKVPPKTHRHINWKSFCEQGEQGQCKQTANARWEKQGARRVCMVPSCYLLGVSGCCGMTVGEY